MRWIVAGLVATVALLVVLTGAVAGISGFADANGLEWRQPQQGPARIPPAFLVLYGEAAARFGIPAPLLAAVGKVESDHGRDPACLVPNVAGAGGPLQFLPHTFPPPARAARRRPRGGAVRLQPLADLRRPGAQVGRRLRLGADRARRVPAMTTAPLANGAS